MRQIKQFQTAVKWLDKGLILVFKSIRLQRFKNGDYATMKGIKILHRTKSRPDALIKRLLKEEKGVHLSE